MNYTVIQKSGWQGASWKVAETFSNKEDARKFVDEKAQSNARDDFYNTRIMTHKKTLVGLMPKYSDDVARFSDGTTAMLPW